MSPDPLPDTQSHRPGTIGAGVRKDQRELVAAKPGYDIGFAGAFTNDGSGLDKCLAASKMTVLVVDRFEAVQVEEDHRQRSLAAHRALRFLTKYLVEVARVRQQREVVGDRERFGPL